MCGRTRVSHSTGRGLYGGEREGGEGISESNTDRLFYLFILNRRNENANVNILDVQTRYPEIYIYFERLSQIATKDCFNANVSQSSNRYGDKSQQ